MESMSNPASSLSILLVEDVNVTLELLTIILTKKYPDVVLHTASNGRTGLELFKTHTPQIVVTDINMPEMGGVQMAEKIHAIKADTKFIVITGNSEKSALEASVGDRFKIDHYIVKPVSFEALFEAIEQCFGEIAHQG